MKELTSRQFIFVVFYLMLSTKLLTIHPLVFEYSGKDSILSIVLGTIFDFAILIFIVFMKKFL